MSKVMTAFQYYDENIDATNIEREHWQNEIIELMDEYAKYLLEAHKEYIKENANYEVGNFSKKDIDKAHKQFLDNL